MYLVYEISFDGIDVVRRGLFFGWWLNVFEVIDGEREDFNYDDVCIWVDLLELLEFNVSLGVENIKFLLYRFFF